MFGKGFLGDIGTRLQRLLKFDGSSDASFDSKAIPVMLVADGTLPGYGERQGRRWTAFNGVAAAGYFYVRATEDVIIQRVTAVLTNPAAGGTLTWSLVPIGTADPGSGPTGIFLDRSLSSDDRPPILGVSNATPTTGRQLGTRAVPAAALTATEYLLCGEPFCLAQGQALVWTCAGVNVNIEIWGQTL